MVTDKNLLNLRIKLEHGEKTWSYVNNTQYTTPLSHYRDNSVLLFPKCYT